MVTIQIRTMGSKFQIVENVNGNIKVLAEVNTYEDAERAKTNIEKTKRILG